jgi:hypothetical protein
MPFQKGQSGNPGGRPKASAPLKELARSHTEEAITTLVTIMKSSKAPAAARVNAACALLDRGFGKPLQQVEHSGELISYVMRMPDPAATVDQWAQETTVQ